ncbi:MAG: polysaccharide deacetylase family protein [Candidatus Nanoarchaeia archaeon]|nr:polysaccharide deacetylase family protein [Candidatus Nanoarchaeia archaeon]
MQRRDFLKILGMGAAASLVPSVLKADDRDENKTTPLEVPVLMYHAVDRKDSIYSRTPERFRQDLECLYEKGYKLSTIEELVSGSFSAEKPVVITFDDARGSQFRLEEEGIITHNCAVGIMEDFCGSHPDFGKTAMFYISFSANAAFGQRNSVEYKLNWLLDNGYEIGNHTMRHTNMSRCSIQEFRDTITECQDKLEDYIGERISLVKSFCFPYCAVPSDENRWEFLRSYFTSATIGGGRSYCNDDLFRIPRYGIVSSTRIERIAGL